MEAFGHFTKGKDALEGTSSRIHSDTDTVFVKFNQTANTGTAMLSSVEQQL